MKQTLLFLAAWTMATAQDANCQTTKTDVFLQRDNRLASTERVNSGINMHVTERAKPHEPVARAEQQNGKGELSAQIKPASPSQSLNDHTRSLEDASRAMQANTRALMDNTKAMVANTEAMQANLRIAEMNRRLRGEQSTQMANMGGGQSKQHRTVEKAVENRPIAAPREQSRPMMASATPAAPVPAVKAPAQQPAMAAITSAAKAPAQQKPEPSAAPVPMTQAALAAAAPKIAAPRLPESLPMLAAARPVPGTMKAKPEAKHDIKITAADLKLASATVPAMPPKSSIGPGTKNFMALTDLMQLPLLDKVYDNNVRDQKHIPVAHKGGFKEGDQISTQGYLRVVATEDSGKSTEAYYLVLTPNPLSDGNCFVVKVAARPEADGKSQETTTNMKKFIRDHLVKGRVPCVGGNLLRKPVYVSVTGDLCYSGVAAAAMRGMNPVYRGKRDLKSLTAWEIRHVNFMEFTIPETK